MNPFKSVLLTLPAAGVLVLGFPGCGFSVSTGFRPGDTPRTSAIFCDVEAGRHCSTPEDRIVGVDIALPYETGFWLGKSLPIGLDYSPAALAACGGQPQTVEFVDAFPTGSAVCVNPSLIGGFYDTTDEACKSWCASHDEWIDADGNPFRCEFISWRSNGADQPFPDACTPAGTERGDFQDPRRLRFLNPVVWTNAAGVSVIAGDLRKTAADGWGNAGAVSTRSFGAGDGKVQTTVAETDKLRIFGLGNGDASQGFEDLEYGLLLTQAGQLIVVESGVVIMNVGPYASGDTLEVAVEGGRVRYKRNAVLLYTSATPPTYPLMVDTAFNLNGGTIQSARIDF